MTNQIAVEFVKNTIAETMAFVERIENAKIKNSLVSHGFVVWNPVVRMAMSYTFKDLGNGKRQAIGGGAVGIMFAERFTKHDATVLAADTFCGHKKVPAVAMFINDAIDLTIADQTELLATLETHLAAMEKHLVA